MSTAPQIKPIDLLFPYAVYFCIEQNRFYFDRLCVNTRLIFVTGHPVMATRNIGAGIETIRPPLPLRQTLHWLQYRCYFYRETVDA
jgi:hypothetical protein